MDATNVRRKLTGFAARLILGVAIVAGGLLVNALAASAQLPPFPQCPPVGLDTSCAILIVFNPDGSTTTLVDGTQPPFDGIEDTLIGVQNNSHSSVLSVKVTGPGITGFDGDGLCDQQFSLNGSPAGCPYGPTHYEGRGSTTSVASTAPGGGNSFTVLGPNDVIVNFSPAIRPGGSAYFSLEGPGTALSVVAIGPPAHLTLSPKIATNTVDTQHCVTATVTDSNGNPVSGVTVRFSVTPAAGRTPSSGSATTNGSGQATFCYTSALPGMDVIHAFADTNNNGMQDANEPFDDATKTWTVPVSTALCQVDVTYGGWIHADNGDKANFGGNAKVDSQNNPQGQEEYQDQGPAQPMNVHSINVLSVVCPPTMPPSASIIGDATIDGAGSFVYRIDVEDVAEPGKGADTYRIRLSNGYDSGKHTLEGGNIQIHK